MVPAAALCKLHALFQLADVGVALAGSSTSACAPMHLVGGLSSLKQKNSFASTCQVLHVFGRQYQRDPSILADTVRSSAILRCMYSTPRAVLYGHAYSCHVRLTISNPRLRTSLVLGLSLLVLHCCYVCLNTAKICRHGGVCAR